MIAKKPISFFVVVFFTLILSKKAFCAEIATPSTYTSKLAMTPNMLLAGQNDGRIWLNPFNGIYGSSDLGITWHQLGLRGRGITDIKYFDGYIYATTYYVSSGNVGLFVSKDKGLNWLHIGPSFSATAVSVNGTNIFLGGYSHGLWVSNDSGETWSQKIGVDGFGPQIIAVSSSNNIVMATTNTDVYKSTDKGLTWSKVSFFSGNTISHISIIDNVIVASSRDSTGVYRSEDKGITWTKLNGWAGSTPGDIISFNGVVYSGKSFNNTNYIVKSTDLGKTWEDTGFNVQDGTTGTVSLAAYYSGNVGLFILNSVNKLYKYEVEGTLVQNALLGIPWNTDDQNDLLDRIYSYFDHEYPLLGYNTYPEPESVSKTTLNFLGIRDRIPNIYYSSHDGYDFALPYGTPVLAADSGYASYYYCGDCGNTIKINHPSGYQTTYMHLQGKNLITTDQTVWVEKGDPIGLIGMTGNTTGPHIHFSVLKDVNHNGSFEDDSPDGRTDPFAWQSTDQKDPWEIYNWTDAKGSHVGAKSEYLWDVIPTKVSKNIVSESQSLQLDNKKVELSNSTEEIGYTAIMTPYISGQLDGWVYVPNSSFLLNIYDYLGNQINSLPNPSKIVVSLSGIPIVDLQPNTLHIATFDEFLGNWVFLDTIYNSELQELSAETQHFSRFAVFGQKADIAPKETVVTVYGTNIDGWYTQFPQIAFYPKTDEDNDNISFLYSLGNKTEWKEYTEPFTITKNGYTTVFYRSIDTNGLLEDIKNIVISVDTENSFKKGVIYKNAQFNTSL